MDLIDRQDVLYQLTTCKTYYNTTYRNETVSKSEITAMINKLPSVKHNLQPTCNQLAIDCISRKEAIDAIDSLPNCYNGYSDSYDKSYIIGVLEELPSAESVIRCKDCKHMIINEKHEAKPMICCFTKMCGTTEPDWFCADGERREDGLN